jgi:hypothetical protein
LLGASACGGESSSKAEQSHSSNAVGGTGTIGGTAGTRAAAGTGGDFTSTGGNPGTGGNPTSTGGSSSDGVPNGGSPELGGTGGSLDMGSGGSAAAPDCKGVVCAPIPNSCKKLVQDPNSCCPTCTDTGCDPCPAIDCAEGSHAETVPGDCCPSCVMNPPDVCARGQAAYSDLRAQLLDKYGSSGCSNSADCTLVREDNACSFVCFVALPSSTADNFMTNLDSSASGCSTCEAPAHPTCAGEVAACVNGKCTSAPEIAQ